MNLRKKKILASRVLNAGIDRIRFNEERLGEIKEAITKQDIRDLFQSGAISIKEIKGRRKIEKRKKRGLGKIKKKVKMRKRDYVKIARKLRKYIYELRKQNKLNDKKYLETRNMIKNRVFKSKAGLQEYLGASK